MGTTPQQENLAVHPPHLPMVAIENQHPSTVLAAKLCRSIKMLSNTFVEDNHFLSAAVDFSGLALETINETLN